MAIVLIIIAVVLFVCARMFYRAADKLDDTSKGQSYNQTRDISANNKTISDSPSSGLPLYQNLSHKEKLNIMSLIFICGGIAKSPYAKQEALKLVDFISKCVGIELEEVKSYVLNLIYFHGDDVFIDIIIQRVCSISNKDVLDMVVFNCHALYSYEPTEENEEHVMALIHRIGYSDQELEELLVKQKAISDRL